ncbi:MAG: M20/M25/M40 family metallo-hydrolase [Candidatus Eisenbacteria bacterium]|nr:M20/M25/M40 family metallo-hydrolase [Candidatus Eisenbacteria bacterium]
MNRVMPGLVAAALLLASTLAFPQSAAAIDKNGLRSSVVALSDPSMEGRAPGSQGLEKAAAMIAARFERAGLVPVGDGGGWFQSFTPAKPEIADAVLLPQGKEWGKIALKNVVGILRGAGDGSVVIGAHYDHLGLDGAGNVYPGADDNASGVAVLCAVADELAKEPLRKRTVVFVAFSGEEAGLLGSRWYAENPILPIESVIAMINLDTVGRIEKKRLLVLSASSAAEFPKMIRGVGLGFDLDLTIPDKGPFGSDQISFIAKGVPALHLFSGPNADYHRTSDTPEKMNYEGLVEIAGFTAELVRYLADRDKPMTFVSPGVPAGSGGMDAGSGASAAPHQMTARRVSLGTIPDMAYQGDGVLVSGVLPGSPAEQAGIKAGDRIVAIDGEKIGGLEDFSGILKSRQPGDKVLVKLLRDGKEATVEAALVERK